MANSVFVAASFALAVAYLTAFIIFSPTIAAPKMEVVRLRLASAILTLPFMA
eukprot:CAMPEP_0183725548 /NCGR_PEP_ID=MMETSP0737-20130205/20743_1 /TAXON_ID=385413 /ORGANISM="Thalassiosira miniscula, Strain CCMP1093" /LENGTH=51 /DNA_ID=CAMNT_0025956567 /DNA_START=47 /DNA_END=198 /DNA_ORIENTATION=+